VDPVPDPLLLSKSSSAGNLTRTSGSVASNSDPKTAEAAIMHIIIIYYVIIYYIDKQF
jgi:hypothetical protein